ncbi:MAG TPA: hypothetical protein VFO27_10355 [Bryobacteraceae bacterium]|nr:hypothetical protein [Bryobacteraceae bacterium]
MRYTIACVIFLFLPVIIDAQDPLTNETILKLVKAGIGEDTIVSMVNQQPGKYSLSADGLVALKTAGVSDKILAEPSPPQIRQLVTTSISRCSTISRLTT